MRRFAVRVLAACALVAVPAGILVVGPGSHSAAQSAAGGPAVFPLPKSTLPGRIAVGSDGSVWMHQGYGRLGRLSPDGRTRELLGQDDYVSDLARGPDGAIWVAAGQKVARVDAHGRLTAWRLPRYGSAEAITTAGGAVWFLNGGNIGGGARPALERLDEDGTTHRLTVRVPRAWLGFNGLTAGPDGALWFTEGHDRGGAIGRMTTDGRHSSWRLPRGAGEPGRIVGGSDGALWFTRGHAIGRITTAGAVTSFPLPSGLAARDMLSGADGALWFASDVCVGRMTTAGDVTTWPVRGARQLRGIAAGPDGTLWLADRMGDAIRRFDPATAPAGPCGAPSVTRSAGATRATVTYEPTNRFDGVTYFKDVRIRITRDGAERHREVVPGLRDHDAFGDTRSLAVRDLDGDGEPEVTLLLNWNGTHCCHWSRVYRWDAARGTYVAGTHFWGNGGAQPSVRDLDGDGRPELISVDDRFFSVFSSSGARPVQVWSYRRGEHRDVTRRHLALVRRDARKLWRLYRRVPARDRRAVLPAWMADQYLLGRATSADRVLETAARRGDLDERVFGPRSAEAYVRAVKALLRRTGYARP